MSMPDDPHGVGEQIRREVERDMHRRVLDRETETRDRRIRELEEQTRHLVTRIRDLELDNEQLRKELDGYKTGR